MPLKRDPSKVLQLGFLALLFLCVLQVGWWIADNLQYTREVREDLATITVAESGTTEALAELEAESAGRVNRYLWEGAFFLLVLFAGMAVLTRTIRHDAELRRRQQNFLAAVSHEFKSPLASMQLSAETLLLRATEPDSQKLGQRILDDCERLRRMVDNLLDTTRLEEGRHMLEPETTVLRDVVETAIAEIAERAERHSIELALDVEPDLVLRIDRTSIETMLRNLLDNAVKACVAGQGHSIGVRASRDDGGLSLTVTDDGLGFPPEDAGMMFEKFYRLGDEQRRTSPGTGLGLYIVKRLADLTNARVSATSAGTGQGASVTLRWPEGAGS
jgi:signal transduction histidine kinase